jgi:hypothetical protein
VKRAIEPSMETGYKAVSATVPRSIVDEAEIIRPVDDADLVRTIAILTSCREPSFSTPVRC